MAGHVSRAARVPKWAAWLSSLLLAFFATAYAVRADATYAITLWPAWFWLVPAAFLMLFIRGKRALLASTLLWLTFGLVFSEEWRSAARISALPNPEWSHALNDHTAIRIVSLNCEAGEPMAAKEILALDPNIILFQESPSRNELETLRDTIFWTGGSLIYGQDTSILADGPLTLESAGARGDYVCAIYQGLAAIRICSLRLMPPTIRFDLWNPDCWQQLAESRRERRKELEAISKNILFAPDMPTIVGGDFNTTPDDGITASLQPKLADSFEVAGKGWGGTGTNEYPVARVDQI